MLNELLILTKIKAGDIKAFEELFRCYYSPLCWYAASITGRMEVAEEIVEELFYVLWKDREQLQIFQSVKNYLYRATRNQSIQYCEHEEVKERYRESVLTASSSEQATDPHQQMEYEELQKLINNTLEKLPERRMQIFKMHRGSPSSSRQGSFSGLWPVKQQVVSRFIPPLRPLNVVPIVVYPERQVNVYRTFVF